MFVDFDFLDRDDGGLIEFLCGGKPTEVAVDPLGGESQASGQCADPREGFDAPVDPEEAEGTEEDLQEATDRLYEVVRTLRGWARVAARSNDSRELQQSLEGILKVVKLYASEVLIHPATLSAVPSQYWQNAEDAKLNPLTPPYGDPSKWDEPWALPPLVRRTGQEGTSKPATRRADLRALPAVWFANEVGRAVVRATELAMQSRTLLDRDTFRLLNTLSHASELFCEAGGATGAARERWIASSCDWNAAIMLRFLTEIGLGVRYCAKEDVDWHFEPCVRLALLHNTFKEEPGCRADVAAAGVLLVLEGLVRRSRSESSSPDIEARNSGLLNRIRAVTRSSVARDTPEDVTVRDVCDRLGRALPEESSGAHSAALPSFGLDEGAGDRAVVLASRGGLEPSERMKTYRGDEEKLRELARQLARSRGHGSTSSVVVPDNASSNETVR